MVINIKKHIKQTKKNIKREKNINKSKKRLNKYSGGGKDNFEITTLDNVNTNKFSISQYFNANIDWGIMPGPPPTDCIIM